MCPNGAAALFTGAKIAHLGTLPQGQPERERRAIAMVVQMDREAFGQCTNIGECEAVCPKEIKLEVIARMHRDYLRATWSQRVRQTFRDGEPVETPLEAGQG
jgi:succinate dehydrogenase / fumarate reductase iron-sulfur subunit